MSGRALVTGGDGSATTDSAHRACLLTHEYKAFSAGVSRCPSVRQIAKRLPGMRERIRRLGVGIAIQAPAEGSTRIALKIPAGSVLSGHAGDSSMCRMESDGERTKRLECRAGPGF